jgi:3-deoxy-manno-octulosonate cytidylyltransferase (CMP-KDO synthetase)
MTATVIIPARYASTRLPGKPLLAETGKPLIQHVIETVNRADCVSRVIVATDDDRIAEAVGRAGAQAVMTNRSCRTGTDRLAEAAENLALDDDEIVVNVQGDEPDIPAYCIQRLVDLITQTDAPMATLATPLSPDRAHDPSKVKVVLDAKGRAMYFSRAVIPHERDGQGQASYLLHLGLYAYRADFLRWFAAARSTPAESCEKLEQLRVLENGCDIAVEVVDYDGAGIDTPEDYAAFVRRYHRQASASASGSQADPRPG